MKKLCSICYQKMDIWTNVHKNSPYADGQNYPLVCFTCYFVPKILEQTYDRNGYIKENLEIPYSCENLNTPQELLRLGSADSIKYAKKSVASVIQLCSKSKKINKNIVRPKACWNID